MTNRNHSFHTERIYSLYSLQLISWLEWFVKRSFSVYVSKKMLPFLQKKKKIFVSSSKFRNISLNYDSGFFPQISRLHLCVFVCSQQMVWRLHFPLHILMTNVGAKTHWLKKYNAKASSSSNHIHFNTRTDITYDVCSKLR